MNESVHVHILKNNKLAESKLLYIHLKHSLYASVGIMCTKSKNNEVILFPKGYEYPSNLKKIIDENEIHQGYISYNPEDYLHPTIPELKVTHSGRANLLDLDYYIGNVYNKCLIRETDHSIISKLFRLPEETLRQLIDSRLKNESFLYHWNYSLSIEEQL